MKLNLSILYIILTVKKFSVVYEDLIAMTVDHEELLSENILNEADLSFLASIDLDYSDIQKIVNIVCDKLSNKLSRKISNKISKDIFNEISKKISNKISEENKSLKLLLDNHKNQTKEYIISIKKELREQITTVVVTTFSDKFKEFKEFKEIKEFKSHDISILINDVVNDISKIKDELSIVNTSVEKIDQLRDDVSNIKDKLSIVNTSVEKIDQLRDDVSNIKGKLSNVDSSVEKIDQLKDDVSEIKGKLSTNFFMAITSVISILTGILLIYSKLPNFRQDVVPPSMSPSQQKNVPSISPQRRSVPSTVPSP